MTHHLFGGYRLKLMLAALCGPAALSAQLPQIKVSQAGRAIIDVQGTAGTGATSALFGGDNGISFQRSFPAIGFNTYRDALTGGYRGKYMKNGYAAIMSLNYTDAGNPSGFAFTTYPNGVTGATLGSGVTNFSLFNYLYLLNSSTGNGVSAGVVAGRGTGIDGTAVFGGTTYPSHINYHTIENTHIRGGRAGSRVYINDLYKGTVIIGSGSTRVGLNAPDPQYPLEIRQVGGTGLKFLITRSNTIYTAEWRVSATSPNPLLVQFNGVTRGSFSSVDGAYSRISDRRLKKNIRETGSLLEKILRLRPVTYEMTEENPRHIRSTGFIAQEVETEFPELVKSSMGNGMRSVNYSGFNILVVKGIQEEQERLVHAEQKAAELEKRLRLLENSLADQ